MENNNLQRTPLFEEHVSLNASMVDFGGWEMPVQYEGILSEYKQTREKCAIFDISHMGEFTLEGKGSTESLENLLTMSVSDIPVMSCRYGAMLNEEGGIIDDLIIFREDEEKWFIVVNSATAQKDAEHINGHISDGVVFKDISSGIGKIDVQGPMSREVLKGLVCGIEKLDYYTFDYFEVLGQNILVSRTGYTGELGYEIYYPWDKTKDLWKELLKSDKVKPAGLGARDVLRLEMGYSLYGHELGEDISPIEAGLGRFVHLEKDFIGKGSLLKQEQAGVQRKIVGIVSDSRRSPRAEHKIYSKDNDEIGVVTSGTFSPGLNKGIGLGFIDSQKGEKDAKIFFGNDKSKSEAIVAARIFYRKGTLKN